jgi:hypothetical protein
MLFRLRSILKFLISPADTCWSDCSSLSLVSAQNESRILRLLKFLICIGTAIATGILLGQLT